MKLHRSVTLFVLAAAAGCTPTIKTQNEITVKPVQVTVDVNLNVKVDQAIAEEIAAPAPAQKSSTDDERRLRRKRFAERRAALNSALKEQLIGENNRGFLELRADDAKVSAELKKLVEAENADRVIVMNDGEIIADDKPKVIFSDVERLKKVGLDVPQTAELLYNLKKNGFAVDTHALSIKEAAEQIISALHSEGK